MDNTQWQVGDRLVKKLRFGSIYAHVSEVRSSSFVIHVTHENDPPHIRDYQSQAIAMQDGWVKEAGDRRSI